MEKQTRRKDMWTYWSPWKSRQEDPAVFLFVPEGSCDSIVSGDRSVRQKEPSQEKACKCDALRYLEPSPSKTQESAEESLNLVPSYPSQPSGCAESMFSLTLENGGLAPVLHHLHNKWMRKFGKEKSIDRSLLTRAKKSTGRMKKHAEDVSAEPTQPSPRHIRRGVRKQPTFKARSPARTADFLSVMSTTADSVMSMPWHSISEDMEIPGVIDTMSPRSGGQAFSRVATIEEEPGFGSSFGRSPSRRKPATSEDRRTSSLGAKNRPSSGIHRNRRPSEATTKRRGSSDGRGFARAQRSSLVSDDGGSDFSSTVLKRSEQVSNDARIVLTYEAQRIAQKFNLDPNQVSEARSVFDAYDERGQGTLSKDNFWQLLQSLVRERFPKQRGAVQTYFPKTDMPFGYRLTFEEFILRTTPQLFTEGFLNHLAQERLQKNAMMWSVSPEEVDNLKKLFDSFDDDRSGFIDFKEFKMMVKVLLHLPLNLEIPRSSVQRLWKEADADGSGQLDFNEFLVWYFEYFSDPDTQMEYMDMLLGD